MVETRPGVIEEVRGMALPSLSELLDDALASPSDVMVSAVLEPLKVRLITKGNSLRYWISRSYQKSLWEHLKKYPQFSPTNRPLGTIDFVSLLDREKHLNLNFPNWVSGDYSAATDNLDIAFTKLAFEESLTHLHFDDDRYRAVLRSVLYEQTIHYPDSQNHWGDLEPLAQTTGQLMGSTLSFPILCSVNIVAYWAALEEYTNTTISLRDLPVLVNGDDILFRADDRLYALWLKHIDSVGFTLSLGKNYVHPTILTMNSQVFHYHNGGFTALPFLNTGLLTSQSKITGSTDAQSMPIWACYNNTIPSV